ncbi:ABC transporter ATP-binding protein [Campylobacter lari]|uniref:Putative iron(III) ABC transporter, ATP-binding protein n=1 Tax=Campylobacter lari (strain RM2100 / D67 / ATCC BAA-1060) TaxID=306263 RepID=B9KE39_CAMLR|nr:ABC transporter ATP-binding protein [Campylobacter lari]ACM64827.2 putative iron(III) ABC transporter, ATP-binding protein [Campylobacter lari RM2100]EAH4936324.1 ABC transporter ATP-binding protein [Campylobacter lari]EAH7838235.1 ABC transporter ATP-binding protein [Campylobacter lari]EAI0924933.1 ABC transporter ATP-binding protein [Campylobacter lari]EAI2015976.1 ABC transporter ATP-binding protein [Campylobacter lari]
MEILKIDNLYKSFGKTEVLKGISLSLREGEIVSILGESGCGKSSLLGCIAGFFDINDGSIYIGDKLVASKNVYLAPQERDVGVLFQDYALFPHLNVEENICFGISSLSKNEQKQRLDEVLEILNLNTLLKRYPNELSGGQAQRVALARTIVARPKIILFDEPFSNLNHTLSVKMRKEIKNILKEHKLSAIFVTHDKDDAFYLSDNIALIKDGKILDYGSAKELFYKPKNIDSACFLGEAFFIDPNTILDENFKAYLQSKNGILRPNDIQISTSQTTLKASVLECVFYGDFYELSVSLEGHIFSIYHHKELGKNDEIYLKLSEAKEF